jgi:phytoene desaturase
VIGAGFAGLSTAAYLSKAGYAVTVFERGDQPGGRARVVREAGFTFELGPSWYLMPDVFDEWFADFGHTTSDFYDLVALDPSYQVIGHGDRFDITRPPHVLDLFEEREPGAGKRLAKLLERTEREYRQVRGGALGLDGLSLRPYLRRDVLEFALHPQLLLSYHRRIQHYVKNRDLQHALEFMTVFMGGSPHNIPAIYSLLAYVDMGLGGWYPMGGFGRVAAGIESVAREQGATIEYNAEVARIVTHKGQATGVVVNGEVHHAEVVVSAADYHFTETRLLADPDRSYDEAYWRKRQLSPSALLVALGVKQRLPQLQHHNLFFDANWDGHFNDVFKRQVWSRDPLFYLCVPSRTDPGVAPAGHENLFLLAPMAAGTQPDESLMNETADRLIGRVEQAAGERFSPNIVTRNVYGPSYFHEAFHAYAGNAFGLSHTLRQTAVLRPPLRSRRVSGLYYAGQYTNPGTGVPMVLLSGKIVTNVIGNDRP